MRVKSWGNLGFLAKEKCQLILPVPHAVCAGTVSDFGPNLELEVDNLYSMILFSKASKYSP